MLGKYLSSYNFLAGLKQWLWLQLPWWHLKKVEVDFKGKIVTFFKKNPSTLLLSATSGETILSSLLIAYSCDWSRHSSPKFRHRGQVMNICLDQIRMSPTPSPIFVLMSLYLYYISTELLPIRLCSWLALKSSKYADLGELCRQCGYIVLHCQG